MVVLCVVHFSRVYNFGKFINFGRGTVWSKRVQLKTKNELDEPGIHLLPAGSSYQVNRQVSHPVLPGHHETQSVLHLRLHFPLLNYPRRLYN